MVLLFGAYVNSNLRSKIELKKMSDKFSVFFRKNGKFLHRFLLEHIPTTNRKNGKTETRHRRNCAYLTQIPTPKAES